MTTQGLNRIIDFNIAHYSIKAIDHLCRNNADSTSPVNTEFDQRACTVFQLQVIDLKLMESNTYHRYGGQHEVIHCQIEWLTGGWGTWGSHLRLRGQRIENQSLIEGEHVQIDC